MSAWSHGATNSGVTLRKHCHKVILVIITLWLESPKDVYFMWLTRALTSGKRNYYYFYAMFTWLPLLFI